jgi:hypothetical protein
MSTFMEIQYFTSESWHDCRNSYECLVEGPISSDLYRVDLAETLNFGKHLKVWEVSTFECIRKIRSHGTAMTIFQL